MYCLRTNVETKSMKNKKLAPLLLSIAANGIVLILGIYFLAWKSGDILFVWTMELLLLAAVIGYLFNGTRGSIGSTKSKLFWAAACAMPAVLLLIIVLDYTKSDFISLALTTWFSLVILLIQAFSFYKQQQTQYSQTQIGIYWFVYILAPVLGFIGVLSLKEGTLLVITLVIGAKMCLEVLIHYFFNKRRI